MNAARLLGLFAAATGVFMLTQVPLGLALPLLGFERAGFGAGAVQGSIWRGKIVGATWRDRSVGDVSVRFSAYSLAIGQLGFDLQTDRDAPFVLNGNVAWVPFRGVAVAGARISAPADSLPIFFNMTGRIDAEVTRLVVATHGCLTSDATIAAQELSVQGLGGRWAVPGLKGSVKCDANDLVLDLAGRDATQAVVATMTIRPAGSFSVKITSVSSDPVIAAGLSAVGFVPGDGSKTDLVFAQEGRWSGS